MEDQTTQTSLPVEQIPAPGEAAPVTVTAPVPSPAPSSGLKTVIMVVALIALIGTGGAAYFISQAKGPQVAPPQVAVAIASPTPPPPVLFLTLESPTADTQTVDGELLVRGKTLPGTTVAIATDTDDTIVESDATGVFQDTILLTDQSDTLTVTAFGSNGEEQTASQSVAQTQ